MQKRSKLAKRNYIFIIDIIIVHFYIGDENIEQS
jgi:hypothetical protein